ncbi:MAG: hypothetical protein MI922_14915 [Bacteroidales bacterium]|nr:hypothetical protein [Bacteroidales bacterium]
MKTNLIFFSAFLLVIVASIFYSDSISAQQNERSMKITTIVTGGLIAGESLALLVGMNLLSSGPNPWNTNRNNIMLGLDIITGAGMIYLGLTSNNLHSSKLLYALTSVNIASHTFRSYEYFGPGGDSKFCFNLPLFIVNNLKLTGAAIVVTQGICLNLNLKL